MRKQFAQAGEGRMKLIFTLAVIAGVFFAGFKFIPVKVQHSKLEDCIIEEAKFATDPRRTSDIIRDNIWECAVEIGFNQACNRGPCFDKKDIQVNKESNKVRVQLEYSRDVVLPGYTYTWPFLIDENRSIY